MRSSLKITIIILILFTDCSKNNDNPVSPQSKSIQIDTVGWIFTNYPSDLNNGYLVIDIILHYSGASLQPNDISYFKITASGETWNPPITSTNLIDSLSEIRQGLVTNLFSQNATVMPIGSYSFELKLTNDFDVSKSVIFPAPGSLSTGGYSFIYTENYSGGVPSTFARMIRRPISNTVMKVNDTITTTFTSDDTLFYNGYIYFFNSSGNYIGYSMYFRNAATSALSSIINNGITLYCDGISQNIVKLSQQNCYIYSPSSFNDIYGMRIVVTDGIQYKDKHNISYDCRAISMLKHL